MVLAQQYMKKLKNILQFKYIIIITIIVIILSLITTKISKPKYSLDEKNFTLIVKNIVHNDGYYTIYLKGRDNVISNYYNDISFEIGDTLLVNGDLSLPSNNTIFNTYNYKQYLKGKNIFYKLDIKDFEVIKKSNNLLYKLKKMITNGINKSNNKEFLYAFILGDKTFIDVGIKESMKTNGIIHLLAISGMHISFFVSISFFILGLLRVVEIKKYCIVFIILLFFAFLTNFTSSILRAIIFFVIKGICKVKRIKISNISVLFITIDIILVLMPYKIFDISMILSFIVTFFILLYINYENSYIKNLIMVSIVSFFASLPIIVNMNYEINLLSIIYNILLVPFFSLFVFPFTILSFFFPIINSISIFFINVFIELNDIFSKIKLIISIPKIPFIFIICYYLLMIIIKFNKRYKKFLLLVLLISYFIPYLDYNYRIYYLNVNQGDSTLIITPKNKSVLIDTGGLNNRENSYKDYLLDNQIKFYKSIGLKKINYLIITHGDYDHMGEAINLINNFKVEKVIFNCGEFNDLEKELIKVLNKEKIKYYSCIKELNIDNNKLHFLQTKEYDNENDFSNVIYTKLNGYKFLFMGDASTTTEKEIMNMYNLPNIDVLKVGHHGSKTSNGKEFIDVINPKYSIISVGKNNR